MSLKGTEIIGAMEFVNNVFKESAEMFKVIDRQFNECDWMYPIKKSNKVITWDTGDTIDNAETWMPNFLSRCFTKKGNGKTKEIIGITLLYSSNDYDIDFKDNLPILCCVRIKLVKPVELKSYNDWYNTWFVVGGSKDYARKETLKWNESVYYDSIISDEVYDEDGVIGKGIISGFYVPLTSIKDSRDIRTYIVNPLFKLCDDDIEGCLNLVKDKAVRVGE